MGVNMFDRPVKANFIDTYAAAPYQEIAAMGQQLDATKAQAEAYNDANLASLQMDALDYGDLEDNKRKQEILGEYEDRVGKLSNMYYQDPEKAKAMAKQLGLDIRNDKTRGEWSSIQDRYDKVQAQKAAYKKKYVDHAGGIEDPMRYKQLMNKYMSSIEQHNWDPSTGTSGAVGSDADFKWTTSEETRKNAQAAGKDIKADQIAGAGLPTHLGSVNYTTLMRDPGKRKFVDWNKAAAVIIGGLSTSDIQSAQARDQYNGVENAGQVYEFNEDGTQKMDKNTGYPVFANTELGRMMKSVITGNTFSEYTAGKLIKDRNKVAEKIYLDGLESSSNLIVSAGEAVGSEGVDYEAFVENRDKASKTLRTLHEDIGKQIPGYGKMSAKDRLDAIALKGQTDAQFKELAHKMEAQQIVVDNMEGLFTKTFDEVLPEAQAKYGDRLEKIIGVHDLSSLARFGFEEFKKASNDEELLGTLDRYMRIGLRKNTPASQTLRVMKKKLKKSHPDYKLSKDFDQNFLNTYNSGKKKINDMIQTRLDENPGDTSRVASPIAATASGKYSAGIGNKEKLYSQNFAQYEWNSASDGAVMTQDDIQKKYKDKGNIDWKKTSVLFTDGLGAKGLPVDSVIFYDKDGKKVGSEQLVRKDGWATYETSRDALLSAPVGSLEHNKGLAMKHKAARVQGHRLGPVVQGANINSMYKADGTVRGKPLALTGIKTGDNKPIYVRALPPKTAGQKTWQLETADGTVITDREGRNSNYIGTEEQLLEVLYNITRP
jgi:hypothetical protein